MKRIFAALVALFIAAYAALAFASPASATGGNQVDGKPVTVCHATGSESNPYVKLTNVQLVQFFGNNGHANHDDDIWAAFEYYTRDGRGDEWTLVSHPAQGDQSLLAFDDCQEPKVDEQATIPDAQVVDKCGTKNDSVSVARNGNGWTAVVTGSWPTFTVTVTADDGFVLNPKEGWALSENAKTATRSFTLTDEDCDLPETGDATTNVVAGIGVLALIASGAVFLYRRRTV
jgi:LPXTG-motif cell wall-anchored protein